MTQHGAVYDGAASAVSNMLTLTAAPTAAAQVGDAATAMYKSCARARARTVLHHEAQRLTPQPASAARSLRNHDLDLRRVRLVRLVEVQVYVARHGCTMQAHHNMA